MIGQDALVAAGALVAPGVEIPAGVLARGIPARVTRDLSPDEIADQRRRTLEYVETARRHRAAQAASVSAGPATGDT